MCVCVYLRVYILEAIVILARFIKDDGKLLIIFNCNCSSLLVLFLESGSRRWRKCPIFSVQALSIVLLVVIWGNVVWVDNLSFFFFYCFNYLKHLFWCCRSESFQWFVESNIHKYINKIALNTGTKTLNILITKITNSFSQHFQLNVLKPNGVNVMIDMVTGYSSLVKDDSAAKI